MLGTSVGSRLGLHFHERGSTLRAIMLNTVIFTYNYPCFHKNSENKCDPSAADRKRQRVETHAQMHWLQGQLEAARKAGDKVLLAMHVPPGRDGWSGGLEWYDDLEYAVDGQVYWVQDYFLKMVEYYHPDIMGILTAHTHTNGIRRVRNKSGKFVELALSIPGVTTDHGNNPGIKIFSYSTSDFELTDNWTFWTDHSTRTWSTAATALNFRKNYACSATARTMFDCIQTYNSRPVPGITNPTPEQKAAEGRRQLFDRMKNTLYVHHTSVSRHKKVPIHPCYERALDVYWGQIDPCPPPPPAPPTPADAGR